MRNMTVTSVQSDDVDLELTATADHDHRGGGDEPVARVLRRELFSDEVIDDLLARVDDGGLSLTGPGGFLPERVKSVLERGDGGGVDRPPGLRQGRSGRSG